MADTEYTGEEHRSVIGMNSRTGTEKNTMRRMLLNALIVILTGIMAYSGYQLWTIYREYNEGTKTYDALAEGYVKEGSPQEAGAAGDQGPACPVDIDFTELRAVNSDIVGWIYCEDTPVNYPVLLGSDNDQYLHHMYNGQYNSAGSIFMDYQNHPDLSDLNTIIYGHHMKNGSMFAMLRKYRDQSYYEDHKVIWYLTPEHTYILNPVAGYVGDAVAEVYSHFQDQQQLDTYLAFAFAHSDFKAENIPDAISRIVVLSTCSYEFQDARYVVVCTPELIR